MTLARAANIAWDGRDMVEFDRLARLASEADLIAFLTPLSSAPESLRASVDHSQDSEMRRDLGREQF